MAQGHAAPSPGADRCSPGATDGDVAMPNNGSRQTILRAVGSRSGSVGVLTAVLLPLLIATAAFTLDFAVASGQKSDMQSAADAAAIAGARELAMGHANTIAAVAKAIAEQALIGSMGDKTPTVDARPTDDGSGVQVVISQPARSFFPEITGSGDVMTVRAVARASGPKLCLLGLDPDDGGTISLDHNAILTADGCAAFSNSLAANGVSAKSASVLRAQLICSAGGFEGGVRNLVGSRMPDCPAVPDPLAGRPTPPVGSCSFMTKLLIEKDRTLDPGVYCGGIEIRRNAVVHMRRGIYVIKDGLLKVDDNARLIGDSVGLYFAGKDSSFEFTAHAGVDLSAPVDGIMAGLLIFGDRSAPDLREFKITSNNARRLLGTIYLPRGYFKIDANNPVADQSAFTVIVARRLILTKSPNLVLKSDYHRTDVPVPNGLGPSSSIVLTN